jgi:hypothetical protein
LRLGGRLVIVTLLDFDDEADAALWRPVDDVVMGGVSSSTFEPAGPGIARFRGSVSLERNGGFASVRTSDAFDGIQYQARFTAPAGTWTDVRLAVDAFVPTFRGRRVPLVPALDPARVRALGLMVSDKQAGAFALLVDRIAVER